MKQNDWAALKDKILDHLHSTIKKKYSNSISTNIEVESSNHYENVLDWFQNELLKRDINFIYERLLSETHHIIESSNDKLYELVHLAYNYNCNAYMSFHLRQPITEELSVMVRQYNIFCKFFKNMVVDNIITIKTSPMITQDAISDVIDILDDSMRSIYLDLIHSITGTETHFYKLYKDVDITNALSVMMEHTELLYQPMYTLQLTPYIVNNDTNQNIRIDKVPLSVMFFPMIHKVGIFDISDITDFRESIKQMDIQYDARCILLNEYKDGGDCIEILKKCYRDSIFPDMRKVILNGEDHSGSWDNIDVSFTVAGNKVYSTAKYEEVSYSKFNCVFYNLLDKLCVMYKDDHDKFCAAYFDDHFDRLPKKITKPNNLVNILRKKEAAPESLQENELHKVAKYKKILDLLNTKVTITRYKVILRKTINEVGIITTSLRKVLDNFINESINQMHIYKLIDMGLITKEELMIFFPQLHLTLKNDYSTAVVVYIWLVPYVYQKKLSDAANINNPFDDFDYIKHDFDRSIIAIDDFKFYPYCSFRVTDTKLDTARKSISLFHGNVERLNSTVDNLVRSCSRYIGNDFARSDEGQKELTKSMKLFLQNFIMTLKSDETITTMARVYRDYVVPDIESNSVMVYLRDSIKEYTEKYNEANRNTIKAYHSGMNDITVDSCKSMVTFITQCNYYGDFSYACYEFGIR